MSKPLTPKQQALQFLQERGINVNQKTTLQTIKERYSHLDPDFFMELDSKDVKGNIIRFLQSKEIAVPENTTLNSLCERYYEAFPEFFDSLNLPKYNKNLLDTKSLSDFDPELDDYKSITSDTAGEPVMPPQPKPFTLEEHGRYFDNLVASGAVPLGSTTPVLPSPEPEEQEEEELTQCQHVDVVADFSSLKDLLTSLITCTNGKGKIDLSFADVKFSYQPC